MDITLIFFFLFLPNRYIERNLWDNSTCTGPLRMGGMEEGQNDQNNIQKWWHESETTEKPDELGESFENVDKIIFCHSWEDWERKHFIATWMICLI